MRISRAALAILATAGLALGALAATAAPAAAATGDQCHRVVQQANGNVGILNGINVYLPDGGTSRGSWFDGWRLFDINGPRYGGDGDRSVNCGDRGGYGPYADVAPAAGYGSSGRR